MSNSLVKVAIVMLVLIIAVLAVAWYDGGSETPRLIEEEVDLSEIAS